MKNSNLAFYFWKILWVIGLIVLGIVSLNVRNQIYQNAGETFNMMPVIWFDSLIPFIFGLYISLIFVKKWVFNINPSLLWCVSIPCTLFSFAFPILVSLSTFDVLPEKIVITTWIMDISSLDVVGIIAGLTIILSFFNTHPNNN